MTSISTGQDIAERVAQMYTRYPFPSAQRRHSYRRHAAHVREYLQQLGIDPAGKHFGDIACGTGLILLDYAQEFPEVQFTGFDITEASVNSANASLAQENVTNAQAYLQNIMELELESEFDYILSWGTIHHLPDSEEGVRILCRALKPGGVIRTGIYGFHGNWERRIQQEIMRTISANGIGADLDERIAAVRDFASGDRNFRNYYTAPPVDLSDDVWVVDEFLHVWEKHLPLRDVVTWLESEGMEVLKMTDYYDQEIPLDIARHSTSEPFIERVRQLPFADQCHIVDMIVRPYWLSLFARKQEQ
ncbi:MAG: class I SAM-dependent methyltransferase [Solirubrobacterales bacterium]|nr:class I SAM-dependent methyltransferase [Solirubrobacterales bacterium]